MKKYQTTILNTLLDQYERSKSFTGSNRNNQSFKKSIVDLFPEYDDEAKYEVFSEINSQVSDIENKNFITVKRRKRGKIDTDVIVFVQLNLDKLDEIYLILGRQPKTDRNNEILGLLNEYKDLTPLLYKFCSEQIERIAINKKVQYSDDLIKFEHILKVLSEIENVEEETFLRNFSVRVLGDSKTFEHIKTSVISVLCEYGDYPDKNCVLQDLNIVSNPGYVYVKGNGQITVSGQTIDLSTLKGDLGLSTALLNDISEVKVKGSKVITIENLTTFNSYHDKEALVIYLGGYHNSIRRQLIRKIYESNPDKLYYHYGDIDAGGFYILLDLRAKTGISFLPLNMDVETIEKYMNFSKKLTDNDRVRLKNLLGGEFDEVINYMLENNCKLEQEAIDK